MFFIICERLTSDQTEKSVNQTEKTNFFGSITV